MHATPHRNVFGITTHYGTHPDPPHPHPIRNVLRSGLTWSLAAIIALRRLRR